MWLTTLSIQLHIINQAVDSIYYVIKVAYYTGWFTKPSSLLYKLYVILRTAHYITALTFLSKKLAR